MSDFTERAREMYARMRATGRCAVEPMDSADLSELAALLAREAEAQAQRRLADEAHQELCDIVPAREHETALECVKRVVAERDALLAREAALREAKDGAYLERNQVVAALAKCFSSGVARTAIEGWSEDWHGCVYIDLPTGQVSWHFHDSQAYLFDGLPQYAGAWDGHDTPEKYRRVAALASAPGEAPALPPQKPMPADFARILSDNLPALYERGEAPAPALTTRIPMSDEEFAPVAAPAEAPAVPVAHYWWEPKLDDGRNLAGWSSNSGPHPDWHVTAYYTADDIASARESGRREGIEEAAIALREWAVARWREEVEHRPLVNKHRRTLDDSWRQVMRYAGLDPDEVVGPSHDARLDAIRALPASAPSESKVTAALAAALASGRREMREEAAAHFERQPGREWFSQEAADAIRALP